MLDFLGKDVLSAILNILPTTKEHYDKDALTIENFS